MSKRLLFCVESTSQANTDYTYIQETIRHYYEDSRKIVRRAIPMESKSRYNSRKVSEKIKALSGSTDTNVIYCLDTDNYTVSAGDKVLLDQIRSYCEANGYDFIFFCRDIEDVFHGRIIPGTDKVQAAARFRNTHAIETVKTSNLTRKDYQIHCSNILNVLDKYLTRKERENE